MWTYTEEVFVYQKISKYIDIIYIYIQTTGLNLTYCQPEHLYQTFKLSGRHRPRVVQTWRFGLGYFVSWFKMPNPSTDAGFPGMT